MIDRKIQPELVNIERIQWVKPLVFDVSAHMKLFWMKEVQNETSRLELNFDAGLIREGEGIPQIVQSLLFSGTKVKSAVQIHKSIDALGGYFSSSVSDEGASVTIYALRENLFSIAKIIKDAIQNLAFVESEVEETLQQLASTVRVNKEKVSMISRRAVRKELFQNIPEYAFISESEYYEKADILRYKRFLNQHYLQGLRSISVVGNVEQDDIDAIIDLFGSWTVEEKPSFQKNLDYSVENGPKRIHIKKENALQTSVRLAIPFVNRLHPDYAKLQILITVLGDYFGSRLMANIREDKGYTYGIGALNVEYREFGFFTIATEVGTEVAEATINEVEFEIKRLQNELIPDDELNLVRNYLLGQSLKSADGPYAMLDLYMSAYFYGLDYSYYDHLLDAISHVTSDDLKALAQKYLKWEDFIIVTAG
ncbi:MAG: M16 family metallopeptidase [Fluviicola sp.]